MYICIHRPPTSQQNQYPYVLGGYGLDTDYQAAGDYYQQAADEAMELMKGKLANKYYMLAEEAWSNVP